MENFDAATTAALQARGGLVAHMLFWIAARNRSTDQVEAIGLWSGEYDATFDIDGQARSYHAGDGILVPQPIVSAPGLEVRSHIVTLAAIAPEVEDLVKGYDTRFAPVEIHRGLFDPATSGLVGAPHRRFRGLVNSVTFPAAEAGGAPMCEIEVVSEARALTRGLALRKSDASHRARGGDGFRRYGDISGSVPVFWGQKSEKVGENKATPQLPPGFQKGGGNG